jgi:hypothetical protein
MGLYNDEDDPAIHASAEADRSASYLPLLPWPYPHIFGYHAFKALKEPNTEPEYFKVGSFHISSLNFTYCLMPSTFLRCFDYFSESQQLGSQNP